MELKEIVTEKDVLDALEDFIVAFAKFTKACNVACSIVTSDSTK